MEQRAFGKHGRLARRMVQATQQSTNEDIQLPIAAADLLARLGVANHVEVQQHPDDAREARFHFAGDLVFIPLLRQAWRLLPPRRWAWQ